MSPPLLFVPTSVKYSTSPSSGGVTTLAAFGPLTGRTGVACEFKALSKGVAYVAGSFFFLDGSHRNTMRLNFSFVAEEKMEPGMKLLGEIIKGRL